MIEEHEEIEAFRSNVREDLWANQMIENQDCSARELSINNATTPRRSEILTKSNETCSNGDEHLDKNIPVQTLTLQEDGMSCIVSVFKTTKDNNKKI